MNLLARGVAVGALGLLMAGGTVVFLGVVVVRALSRTEG